MTCSTCCGQGAAAILLDGLDEVSQAADERRRAQIQTFVGELAEEFDDAPIIITARPYAYGQDAWRLPGFGHTTLIPLDRPRQAELAGRIFAALAASDPRLVPAGAEQETATFVAALAEVPDDLASNPLLLTLLMAIWLKSAAHGRSLPSTAARSIAAALIYCWKTGCRRKSKDSVSSRT